MELDGGNMGEIFGHSLFLFEKWQESAHYLATVEISGCEQSTEERLFGPAV